tara:strand:- start:3705 stop:4292 length:588 start_codon:yes stop_codon:yes gene_type:complete
LPRTKSDKTITHRIELGLPERAELKEIIATQKENQRLDAVTNTLQAVGTGLAGGGMIWAAAALAAYLAPGLIDKTKDKVENFVNDIIQPIADPITNTVVEGMKEEVEQSQNFVVNARNKVNSFCDPNSIHYDEDKCNQAQIEYEAAKIQAQETQEAVLSQAQAIKDEIKAFREGEDSVLQLLPFGKTISKVWSLF